MRRIGILVAIGFLAWPVSAAGKQGAMFVPHLSILLPGQPQTVRLFVLPVYSGWREVVPAPKTGTVPVVTMRSRGTGRMLRFRGTPIRRISGGPFTDSIVRIILPHSSASQTWEVSVSAGGRAYPSELDSRVTIPGEPTSPSNLAHPVTGSRGAEALGWPVVLAALMVAVGAGFVLTRGRRASPRLDAGG
jgi:hypothetical protein